MEIVAGIVAGNHHWRLVLENVAEIVAGNHCAAGLLKRWWGLLKLHIIPAEARELLKCKI